MMKTFILSALALGVMTSAAIAEPKEEPRKMSEDQMADVTAGLLNLPAVIRTNGVLANAATAAAIGLLASGTTSVADANTSILQDLDVVQVESE
jgi:hypothetical protein